MVVLIPVESSMMAAVGYDPHDLRMVVLFNNGRAYDYYGVPTETFGRLMAAESKGRFMHQHVLGVFPYAPFRGWDLSAAARPARVRARSARREVARR